MHDDDPLTRLERAAAEVVDQRDRALAKRTDLQWTHALVAVVAGLLILFWGLAANIELHVGQWTRPAVGLLALTGGLVLARAVIGRRRGHPRPRWETTGLLMVLALDAVLVGGFTWAVLEVRPMPSLPWQPLDQAQPRPYPIAIYVGLVAMLRIHYVAARDHFGLPPLRAFLRSLVGRSA